MAAGKKVQLYQWQNIEDRKLPNIVNYFELVKEVIIAESPSLLTLVDRGGNGYTLCVGYRNQFDLIDTASGKTTKLHEIDAASPKVCEPCMSLYTVCEVALNLVLVSNVAHYSVNFPLELLANHRRLNTRSKIKQIPKIDSHFVFPIFKKKQENDEQEPDFRASLHMQILSQFPPADRYGSRVQINSECRKCS